MRNLEILNKKPTQSSINIALFFIIFFQTGASAWVSDLLFSLGIPYLRFQKLFFLYIPVAFILFENLMKNKIILDKIYLIIFFLIIHFSMENYLYKNYEPNDPIELNRIWISILIGYLALINSSINYQKNIINYFLVSSTLIYLVVYLDLLLGINVAGISVGEGQFEGRLNSEINLNNVCDIGAFSILLLFYNSQNFSKQSFLKIPSFFWVLFFILLIFLQASRGSIIVLIPLALIYFLKNLKSLRRASIFFMLLGFVLLADFSLSRISLFNRISNLSVNEKLAVENFDGRSLQVFSSLRNFSKSPIIGVGYKNAAKGYYYGITRSNFQYSQILASGGLVLFVLYFYMNFRIFSNGLKSLFKDEFIFLFFLFVLIFYTFRRPVPFFCVIAYLVYCRKFYENKE